MVIGIFVPFNANANMFFWASPIAEFIRVSTSGGGPAQTVSHITYCVKSDAKVGDIETATSGNTQKVVALLGTSSVCKNPNLPVNAELEFKFIHESAANVKLPPEFEATKTTDLEKYNGYLIRGRSELMNGASIDIISINKDPKIELKERMAIAEKADSSGFKEGFSVSSGGIKINGIDGARFEIEGTKKGFFGKDTSIIFTVLENANELLILSGRCASIDYLQFRSVMIKMMDDIAWSEIKNEPMQKIHQ